MGNTEPDEKSLDWVQVLSETELLPFSLGIRLMQFVVLHNHITNVD